MSLINIAYSTKAHEIPENPVIIHIGPIQSQIFVGAYTKREPS